MYVDKGSDFVIQTWENLLYEFMPVLRSGCVCGEKCFVVQTGITLWPLQLTFVTNIAWCCCQPKNCLYMQAIRDGVIEATIDHEQGFMQSKVRNYETCEKRDNIFCCVSTTGEH